jgi:hypothetical protein
MNNTPQGNNRKTKRLNCWLARIFGIIGIFLALLLWSYSLEAIHEDPNAIPIVILLGVMMVGGILDCVLIGREGIGGMIILLSGIVFYLYILFDVIVLGHPKSEGQIVAIACTLLLFLAGFLFYVCGRKRREFKD